jgi:RNA polymerase sigma-70 factor (ECF subfamily)
MENLSLKQSETSFFISSARSQVSSCYDDDLARSASTGCEASFAELLSRHRRMVANVVRRYFERQDEIEELMQVTFIEAWGAIGSYRGRGPHSFAAWLARIAVTSCFDELRRRRRSREDIISQLGESGDDAWFELLTAQATSDRPEHTAINRNLAIKLMMLLEPNDRLAFVMLKAGDFSIAEIASVIGWSEAKVKMRIHRAKSILQRKVKRLT